MDSKTLHAAIGTLLADDPARGDEEVHLSTGYGDYILTGITVVVESDHWVPNTIFATVDSLDASADDDEDSEDSS